MDYPRFVASRKAVWEQFESTLGAARRRPRDLDHETLEQLAVTYRQVLHDQALAQARFPGTGTVARLRRLCLDATYFLRRDATEKRLSVAVFFRETLPRSFRSFLPELGMVTALFIVAALLGLAAVALRPEAATALLGAERVARLREGHLWTESLTTTVPPAASSSLIATNIMSVALLAFAGGALAGLGALYVTLLNGFLLGATFAVTMHYSMAGQLAGFVVAHGGLEITLILVCAAAGLGIGRAMVMTSDRPRADVVRETGLKAPSDDVATPLKAALGIALVVVFFAVVARPQGDAR